MSAPLIVRAIRPEAGFDEQEVATVMLGDFTFRDPAEILTELRHGQMVPYGSRCRPAHMDMPGMNIEYEHARHVGRRPPGHFNDIAFDAYLPTTAPSTILKSSADRSGKVRLRIIKRRFASTNFMIDFGPDRRTDRGSMEAAGGAAECARRLPQVWRKGPTSGAAFGWGGRPPILFQREGAVERTSIILATPGCRRPGPDLPANRPQPPGLDGGRVLPARSSPLKPRQGRPPDRHHRARRQHDGLWLGSAAAGAGTGIIEVRRDQRVEIEMINPYVASGMHLHGHHFQVVGTNGCAVESAVREPPSGAGQRAGDDRL